MPTVIDELLIAIGVKGNADRDLKKVQGAAREAGTEFKKTEGRASRLGKGLAGMASKAAKAGAVLTGVLVGGIVAATKSVVDQTVELDRWTTKLSATAEEVQQFEIVQRKLNVNAENGNEAIKTLRENLGELARIGTGPAKDALGSLGLTLEDINGLGVEDQLAVLSDALLAVEDPAKRLSIAIEVMGEDGAALLPVLDQGSAKIRELGREARETGRIASTETVEATLRLNREVQDLKLGAEAAALEIASRLVPRLNEWFDENEDLIDQRMPEIIDATGDAAEALAGSLGKVVIGLSNIYQAFKDLQKEAARDDTWFGKADEWILNQQGYTRRPDGSVISIEDREAQDAAFWERIQEDRRTGRPQVERAEAANQRVNAIAQAGLEQARREEIVEERRARAKKFEDQELASQNASKKSATEQKRREREEADARKRAADEFGEELRLLAERFGANQLAITASIDAAAGALLGGATDQVARRAGLGRLGGLVGQDLVPKSSGDPLLSQIFGENMPDVELSTLARGAEPTTLISEITNTFSFEINQAISAPRPEQAGRESASAIRDAFEGSVERSTRTAQVKFAR